MLSGGWWVLRGGGLWWVFFNIFSTYAYMRTFLRKTHHNPPPEPNPPPSFLRGAISGTWLLKDGRRWNACTISLVSAVLLT